METTAKIISNVCLFMLLFSSLWLIIGAAICERKMFKQQQADFDRTEKLIDKKCKEIENSIGKELAETKKDNERLKRLCDRTLESITEKNKELAALRSAKGVLKKENKELQEQLEALVTKKK